MATNEHILFQDIPIRGRLHDYHSAVLTTFSVDLVNIDSRIRNILRRKKICSLNIFADKTQLDNAYTFVSPQSVPHLGREYSISSVNAIGAFHPKINFFAGYNSALCLIGSGNLTVGGHGKNHELFTGFMVDDEDTSHLPIIRELWSYLCNIAKSTGEFEQQRVLKEIPQNCTLLKEAVGFIPHQLTSLRDDLGIVLLYNDGNSSIFSQMKEIIPFSAVKRVTIVSPFFDEDGRTLNLIQKECASAEVNVIVQENSDRLPFKLVNENIHFFNFNKTTRGKKNFKNFQRTMHSKMLLFETEDSKFCIVGSANATQAALGNDSYPGANYEMCVLYVSAQTDFLKELELTYSKKDSFLIKQQNLTSKNPLTTEHYLCRIKEAQIKGNTLIIDLPNPSAITDSTLILDDGFNIVAIRDYEIIDGKICANITVPKNSAKCYIINSDEQQISNTIFVQNITALHNTNPSKSSRELNGIISKIQVEGHCGLDVVTMLGNVLENTIEEHSVAKNKFKSKEIEKINSEKLPEIKYNPEFNNPEYDEVLSIFQNRNFGSRMIECIEDRLRQKLRKESEQQIDEEEEANPESSQEREEDDTPVNLLSKNELKEYPRQIRSLWNLYERYLSQRETTPDEIITYTFNEDVSFFTLTLFSTLEITYLNRLTYEFKKISSLDGAAIQKELFHTFDNIMATEGIKNMARFATYIEKHHPQPTQEMTKEALWAIKYLLIFKYLFGRMYPYSPIKLAKENSLIRIIATFLKHFGFPEEALLENEINPIIENYNNLFEFRHIQKTLNEFR